MATTTRDDVEMFMSITGASEPQAARKLEEYGGDLSLAVNAYFVEGIDQRANASSAVYPDTTSIDTSSPHAQQRGILPFFSAVRGFKPPSLVDADNRRNLLNQIGIPAFNNSLPVASNASQMGRSDNGSQSGLRPPVYAHNQAEAYSPNLYDASAEEQMLQAAIEASMHEEACKQLFQVPSGHGFLHRDAGIEDAELSLAIAQSLMTAEQEKAKHKHQMKDRDQEWKIYALGERTGSMNVDSYKGSSSHADGAGYSEGQATGRSSQDKYNDQHGFHASESDKEPQRMFLTKKSVLPEEPPLDGENTINLVVRMLDGTRHGRRFLKSDKLQSLFDFIDHGGWVEPGTYRLVIPYPHRALEPANGSQSLSEFGLTSKQVALYLELA